MACFFMPLATPNRATPKSCYPFKNISKKKKHNLKQRLKPSKEKHRPGGNLSTCNCTKLPKRPSFSKFGTPKLKFLSFSQQVGVIWAPHISAGNRENIPVSLNSLKSLQTIVILPA
jgi:hypothetical protein